MKSLLFSLVCLFTFQIYGQQGMNQKNQNSSQENTPKEQLAQEPTTEIVLQKVCPVEGYKVTLSRDKATNTGVNERRYIQVAGIRKHFYATAVQAATLPNFSGVPQPNSPPVIHNGTDGYLSVENVTIDPLKKYCDRNGHRLVPANDNIYKVYMGSNHPEWSGSVTITSGSNLDSADIWFLVKTYNDKRFVVESERVPQECQSGCYNAGGDGVEPDEPDGTPTTWVDASGEVHDWFDNEDGQDGGMGNPSGGIGSTVLYEKMSLVAAGTYNSLGDDVASSGYANQMYGIHLGAYFPIYIKHPLSYGVYASGDYLTSNKDNFRHQPEGFKVSGMPSSVRSNSENNIKQSLMMVGVGPQINLSLGRKAAVSAIIQGGLTSFKQSEFSFIQEFEEGDERIPVEIFNQKETKSTNFFWIPRLRITYALASKIGIWIEGNYMMGTIKADQTELNPGDPIRDDGSYSFGQVNGGEQMERTNQHSLKGAGLGAGITIGL